MGRLVGVRQQLDWTWYDTALHADGPCGLQRRVTLYGVENVHCLRGILTRDLYY